jgi:4-hydroxythreonine-4-phosphate dehydrogenase
MTEYISDKFKIKKNAMLIYNEKISVCPVTTHLPLKMVSNKINQKIIKDKIVLIDNFYRKIIGFKPKIAVTGLNPHCESILRFNEDSKIIYPAIKSLKKKGFNISGPFSADTIFLKQNRTKYDVILGMYHDQVLSPLKALIEYDAINITLGLPFLRISPDHGPNEIMINKNLSNPLSLIKAIKFLDKK